MTDVGMAGWCPPPSGDCKPEEGGMPVEDEDGEQALLFLVSARGNGDTGAP